MVKLQNLISRKSVPPFQKQPFADILQSGCSKKLRNIHRKTTGLESLFNKVPVLSSLQLYSKVTPAKVFPCEFCKTFKNSFFYRTSLVAASALLLSFEIITDYLLLIISTSYFAYFNPSKQAT